MNLSISTLFSVADFSIFHNWCRSYYPHLECATNCKSVGCFGTREEGRGWHKPIENDSTYF